MFFIVGAVTMTAGIFLGHVLALTSFNDKK